MLAAIFQKLCRTILTNI